MIVEALKEDRILQLLVAVLALQIVFVAVVLVVALA